MRELCGVLGHAWNWRPPRRFLFVRLRGYSYCYWCGLRKKGGKHV